MSNKKVASTGTILAASVLLIGLIMRSPITTLPLMLTQISGELGVDKGQLGILTTIVVLWLEKGVGVVIGINLLGDSVALGRDDANDADWYGSGWCRNCALERLYANVRRVIFLT